MITNEDKKLEEANQRMRQALKEIEKRRASNPLYRAATNNMLDGVKIYNGEGRGKDVSVYETDKPDDIVTGVLEFFGLASLFFYDINKAGLKIHHDYHNGEGNVFGGVRFPDPFYGLIAGGNSARLDLARTADTFQLYLAVDMITDWHRARRILDGEYKVHTWDGNHISVLSSVLHGNPHMFTPELAGWIEKFDHSPPYMEMLKSGKTIEERAVKELVLNIINGYKTEKRFEDY